MSITLRTFFLDSHGKPTSNIYERMNDRVYFTSSAIGTLAVSEDEKRISTKCYKNSTLFQKIKLLILRIFGFVVKIDVYNSLKNDWRYGKWSEYWEKNPEYARDHVPKEELSSIWINKRSALKDLAKKENQELKTHKDYFSQDDAKEELNNINGEDETWALQYIQNIENKKYPKDLGQRIRDYLKYITAPTPGDSYLFGMRTYEIWNRQHQSDSESEDENEIGKRVKS